MNLCGVIFISIGLLISRCVSDQVPENGPSLYCTDLNPQNSLDIEQVRKFMKKMQLFIYEIDEKECMEDIRFK